MPTVDVKISNFLKITNAQFQVKPFTLIAGKNASGKSSITRLMYCILQTLNKDHLSEGVSEIVEGMNIISEYLQFLNDELDNAFEGAVLELADLRNRLLNNTVKTLSFNVESKELIEVIHLLERLTSNVNQFNENIDDASILENVIDVLDSCLKRLVELNADPIGFSRTQVVKKLSKSILEVFQVNDLNKLHNKNTEESPVLLGKHFWLSFNRQSLQFNNTDNFQLAKTKDDVTFYQQFDNIVYLESPVYLKLKGAISKLIDYDSRPNLHSNIKRQEQQLTKVPQYILDTFEMLKSDIIVKDVHPKIVEVKQDIAKLLGGQLHVTDGGDIQFISQNENGKGSYIDINHTASGTTALGTIALLLDKNIVVPNSVLIFDEPEVNLHPAWQHAMIQILYKLSLANITIVMATHSYDMLNAVETCMDDMEDKGDDVGQHFSIIQLDDGKTVNENKPVFKKLDAVKADLSQPIFDLLTGAK